MENGIYEQLITNLLHEKLKKLDCNKFYVERLPVDAEKSAMHLSMYLIQVVRKAFKSIYNDNEQERIKSYIGIINAIITLLSNDKELDSTIFKADLLSTETNLLGAVIDLASCDYPDVAQRLRDIRPQTTITFSHLFTGSRNNSVSLGSELKREIDSADKIDMIVSFIRMSGLNGIFENLEEFTRKGNKLRVMTTTYTKASEFKAIKKLAELPNCQVKVSYDEQRTRLHAKSYIFFRNSGFNTAYVGSSNLSNAALEYGTEWNMKVTELELPKMLESIRNSFESLWQYPGFETYMPGRDDEKLARALDKDNRQLAPKDIEIEDVINAFAYQNDILSQLDAQRQLHGNYRNLVAAATGTGKTVIAAFDYKRFSKTMSTCNLLFVAHREEILNQAMKTFRTVLGNQNFGDLWYNGQTPSRYNHLFASKQMLDNNLSNLPLGPDYYDYIVIDEAHHSFAESYKRIIEHFNPKILLGLTATPGRMDGGDILQFFGNTISAEIDLTTAINNQILVPFHYYGISDGTDLTCIKWNNRGFDIAELSNYYEGNTARSHAIVSALNQRIANPYNVKALCFCVSQSHARYMKDYFIRHGLNADYLVSENSDERRVILNRLKNGKVNYLFVVDMFNEGVDIPAIDTVLFLRPTESLTVYLQQLGRGLRKYQGKAYLNVFDFVGHTRSEFNYEARFRALQGRTSISPLENIKSGFSQLPLGCQIDLDPKAKEEILENIEQHMRRFKLRRLVQNVQNFSTDSGMPLSLANFMKYHDLSLSDIFKRSTWGQLKYDAGKILTLPADVKQIQRAVVNKWLATDSFSYFSLILKWVSAKFRLSATSLSLPEQRAAMMLYYDLYNEPGRFGSLQGMFDHLSLQSELLNELAEILPILLSQCKALEEEDNSPLANTWPLKLHATYTKSQILAAFGMSNLERQESDREGVKLNKSIMSEAIFVDIIKNREEGSSTNYDDFAQSPELFMWETQNRVSQASPTGQDYIHGRKKMLLFVRRQATRPEDKTLRMGYQYLGQVFMKEYSGERPMKILWELKTPMPPCVFEYAAKFLVS